MNLIFKSAEYEVYVNDEVMRFKPLSGLWGRVLLITPPGIKPQFYSLIPVLLSKVGIDTFIPIKPIPCSAEAIEREIHQLINMVNPDIVVTLGIKISLSGAISVGFDDNLVRRQLTEAFVPGSMYVMSIDACGDLIKRSMKDFDLLVKDFSVSDIVEIRDFVIDRLRKLKNAFH